MIGNYCWYILNDGSPSKPKAVGQKWPNAGGLYDMGGNVWEWCSDIYGPYTAGSFTNPIGAAGPGTDRVIRGGSYGSTEGCKSGYRTGAYRSTVTQAIFLGLRLVLVQ